MEQMVEETRYSRCALQGRTGYKGQNGNDVPRWLLVLQTNGIDGAKVDTGEGPKVYRVKLADWNKYGA